MLAGRPRSQYESPAREICFDTDAIRFVIFSPDATRVAVLTRTEARLLDTATGKDIFPAIKIPAIGTCVAFSPDGKILATACGDEFVLDRQAQLWDAATGKSLSPPMEHNGAIQDIKFSPDGARLLTASHDRNVRVWDGRTGKILLPPLRHAAGVSAAAFSADARWIATFAEDGTARVWDAELGEPLTPPLKNPGALTGGGFLAGGKFLVAQSGADSLALWELPCEARSVTDWHATASLLSAREFNPAGFTEPLRADDLRALWPRQHAAHPADFVAETGNEFFKPGAGVTRPPNTLHPVPVK